MRRDTTCRSPRLSRLSPRPNSRQAATLPNVAPHAPETALPAACLASPASPLVGKSAPLAQRAQRDGETRAFHPATENSLNFVVYEQEGPQEGPPVPPAGPCAR